jgi:hypothetical protein
MNPNTPGTDISTCQQLFFINLICNLIVAIMISIIVLLQLIWVFLIAKRFFLIRHVEHSARCEDENLVVIGA